MKTKDIEKNKDTIKELEKKTSPILVVNNSSLRPYVELFEYYPENIYQQPLGSLLGFFEIKEYSDDSAYIVNFLTSVLKKEYYINPRRSVTESLDSALHRVNMALSELVKQGNVEWLGKLNAAVCVLDKNSAHFSVAGTAKIFLFRNESLSEISEDLAPDSPEPHPLKTFVNVSSGRLEKDDFLIITPEDIFHILPLNEIRKSIQRYKGDKFVQFLKTALSNQIEMISVIAVEMKEAEIMPEVKLPGSVKKISTANFFSEKTFAEAMAEKENSPEENDEFEQAEMDEEKNLEYTDKKTGHIFIQGEANESEEAGQTHLYWEIAKEKTAQIWYASKNSVRQKISSYKNRLAKKHEFIKAEKEKQKQIAAIEKQKELERKEAKKQEEKERKELEKRQKIEMKKNAEKLRKKEAFSKTDAASQKDMVTEEEIKKNYAQEKSRDFDDQTGLENRISFREKLQMAIEEEKSQKTIVYLRQSDEKEEEADFEKFSEIQGYPEESIPKSGLFRKLTLKIKKMVGKIQFFMIKIFRKTAASKEIGKFSESEAFETAYYEKKSEKNPLIPNTRKIKRLFLSFGPKQKMFVLLAVLLIFTVPFFINRQMEKPKELSITEVEKIEAEEPKPLPNLSNEKNIELSPEKKLIISKEGIVGIIQTNTGILLILKNSVISIDGEKNENEQEYALQEEFGNALKATFMKDLSLVFIITDKNKLISFSPVSNKFSEESIKMPNNPSKLLIGTYMTYLYIADPESNKIYRYPRAIGGFGEKSDWLKESIDLSKTTDIVIDDNIYLAQGNQMLKLFKGKKEDFNPESSYTPISFDKIYTDIDDKFIYIIDAKNSRLIKFNKESGSIEKQYYDEELRDAVSISIDEKNNKAYASTSGKLFNIGL